MIYLIYDVEYIYLKNIYIYIQYLYIYVCVHLY